MSVEVVLRRCARVLLIAPDSRLLLFHVFGLAGRYAWVPPGGLIEGDETYADAARRELAEETGSSTLEIRDLDTSTREQHLIDGCLFDCFDHFFVARTSVADIDISGFTSEEQWRMKHHRWWDVDEIARSNEEFFPRDVPRIVRDLPGSPLCP